MGPPYDNVATHVCKFGVAVRPGSPGSWQALCALHSTVSAWCVPGAFWGVTSGKTDCQCVMDDHWQNTLYAMKVIQVETAGRCVVSKSCIRWLRVEMLHPDGKAMLNDEVISIGLELFTQYIDADNERKENERAEAKAREDALPQQSSFENAETIVDEKEQTLDSAGHRWYSWCSRPRNMQWLPRSLVLRSESVLSQV